MAMAGLMERHRELRVILAHGGGALLALRGRLRHAHGFQPEAQASSPESPLTSIRRFHFDTITQTTPPRELIALAGPERVLLGSDYPFDMADPDPAARSVRSGWATGSRGGGCWAASGAAARRGGAQVHA